MKPSRELRDLVLGLYHDWSTGNHNFDLFSLEESLVGIGTSPEEFWVAGGRELKALACVQVEEMGSLRFSPGVLYAVEEGTVGWVCDNPTIEFENGLAGTVRMTWIFHREGAEWKIVHQHASLGIDSLDVFGREFTTSIDAIAHLIDQDRPDLAPVASAEGTVTIMFTDMEASTALNEALGDDKFLPLHLKHNEIVHHQTRGAGGTVVKSQGDGFMLAFPSARRGVDCAIAVQRDVAELDARIRVRMGLHTGEPIRHSDDFFGRDVAYAARLGAAATGGEILVSSLVKSLVEPSGSFSFDGPRQLELKGFDGPQPVFAVDWSEE